VDIETTLVLVCILQHSKTIFTERPPLSLVPAAAVELKVDDCDDPLPMDIVDVKLDF